MILTIIDNFEHYCKWISEDIHIILWNKIDLEPDKFLLLETAFKTQVANEKIRVMKKQEISSRCSD